LSKRTTKRTTEQKTEWYVIAGIIVIAVLVVAVLIQAGRPQTAQTPGLEDLPTGIETGVTPDGHPYRGSLSAKVVVVEYEDLRCPFCRQHFVGAEPQILEQYVKAGLVREESRIVPILGSPSVAAAEAAACAGEQNKYWEFRHVAFANQPLETDPYGRANLVKFAEAAGLDIGRFTTCFDTQRYQGEVETTLREAQSLGVSSTPTFFVNGVKYEGAVPFERDGGQGFKDILDAALQAVGAAP